MSFLDDGKLTFYALFTVALLWRSGSGSQKSLKFPVIALG